MISLLLCIALSHVTDDARVITDVQRMENALAEYQAATGTDIRVFAVVALNGISIEDHTTFLWGQFGGPSRILIVVAPADRRVRIYRGAALARSLPTSATDHAIQRMYPQFQAYAPEKAIWTGIGALRTSLSSRPASSRDEVTDDDVVNVIFWFVFIFLVVMLLVWLFMRHDRGGGYGGSSGGNTFYGGDSYWGGWSGGDSGGSSGGSDGGSSGDW